MWRAVASSGRSPRLSPFPCFPHKAIYSPSESVWRVWTFDYTVRGELERCLSFTKNRESNPTLNCGEERFNPVLPYESVEGRSGPCCGPVGVCRHSLDCGSAEQSVGPVQSTIPIQTVSVGND